MKQTIRIDGFKKKKKNLVPLTLQSLTKVQAKRCTFSVYMTSKYFKPKVTINVFPSYSPLNKNDG